MRTLTIAINLLNFRENYLEQPSSDCYSDAFNMRWFSFYSVVIVHTQNRNKSRNKRKTYKKKYAKRNEIKN